MSNSLEQLQKMAENLQKTVIESRQILETANDGAYTNLTDDQKRIFDKYTSTINNAIATAKEGNIVEAQELIKQFQDGSKNSR